VGLFDSAHQWVALGRAFGLAPYKPTASFGLELSFRQIKRALGLPAWQLPPTFDQWLYGKRGDVEVLLLMFEVGSGSSSTTHTAVVARIDPPLFLGLSINRRPGFEIFATPRLHTGDAAVDTALRVSPGFDPARTFDALGPHGPAQPTLLGNIARDPLDLRVSDSMVVAVTEGTITEASAIAQRLDAAVALATTLAARKAKMKPSEPELVQQADWQRFADAGGFTLDRARMTLAGSSAGSEIKIALETVPGQIHTSVNVRFPRAVHVAFTAVRAHLPPFLQGLFGQDIKVGDQAFDDLFVVTGYPEPVVRQALARPELLRAMTQLASVSAEVQLNHAQLFFRVKGPTASPAELASIVETARVTSTSLFGAVADLGPYR
jgi:hypothetical protein